MNYSHFAQLVFYDHGNQIQTVLMNKPQITIGRTGAGGDCDVYLSSPLVSSIHGLFNFYEGEYYYTDYNNTNGTFLNGKKVEHVNGAIPAAIKLRDGDILSIGQSDISKEKTVYVIFTTSVSTSYKWNAFSLTNIKSVFTAGRSLDCDIVISNLNVSRRHVVFTKDSLGNVFIKDCNSLNSTIVNGVTLLPGQTVAFNERSTASIGSVKIINLGTVIVYCTPGASDFFKEKSFNEVSLQIPPRPERRYPSPNGVELRVENVSKIVPCKKGTGINGSDKKYILQNISLTVYPGELVAILGGSGAGKTTFMNAVNGFEPATSGRVLFNGNDLNKNYQAHKSQIGYVPQQDIVYDNLTMKDMLTYVARLRLPDDLTKDEIDENVNEVLKSMDLLKQKETMIKKLSGGQRKRASIAVELISDPSLFFLDEPTSGLDPEAETNLMKLLRNLSTKKGKTVIVITHTLQNIHLFDKIIFLAPGGKLCFYGTPEDALGFFDVKNLSDAYEKISSNVDYYVNKCMNKR